MSTILEDAVFLTGLIECDPFYKPETHPHGATVLRVAADYIKQAESLAASQRENQRLREALGNRPHHRQCPQWTEVISSEGTCMVNPNRHLPCTCDTALAASQTHEPLPAAVASPPLGTREWIQVEDRTPPNDDCVIAYGAAYDVDAFEGFYKFGRWYATFDGIRQISGVTHWMPFPELPQAEQSEARSKEEKP